MASSEQSDVYLLIDSLSNAYANKNSPSLLVKLFTSTLLWGDIYNIRKILMLQFQIVTIGLSPNGLPRLQEAGLMKNNYIIKHSLI